MNQELEQIFSHPDFIELVIELIGEPLGERVTPIPIKESGDDKVTERIRRKILLRLKTRHTEKEELNRLSR